jgi:hypothetical protein
MTLNVISALATDIQAELPAGVDAATYLLVVVRAGLPSLPFEVTIAAAGAEGPVRPAGPVGPRDIFM